MTRKPHVRNVGALCLGTALLSYGCTQSEKPSDDDGLEFSEEPKIKHGANSNGEPLPKPSFGPLARKVLDEGPPEKLPPLALPVRPQSQEIGPPQAATPKLRTELLNSVSDATLIETAPAQIIEAGDDEPIGAEDTLATAPPKPMEPDTSEFMQPAKLAAAQEALIAPAQPLQPTLAQPVLAQPVLAQPTLPQPTPLAPNSPAPALTPELPTPAGPTAVEPTTTVEASRRTDNWSELLPNTPLPEQDAVTEEPPIQVQLENVDTTNIGAETTAVASEMLGSPDPSEKPTEPPIEEPISELRQSDALLAPAPAPETAQKTEIALVKPEPDQPDAAPEAEQEAEAPSAFSFPGTDTESFANPVVKAKLQEPAGARRRSIPIRTDQLAEPSDIAPKVASNMGPDAGSNAAVDAGAFQAEKLPTELPTLASVMPPQRSAVPMVTLQPARPEIQRPKTQGLDAANDVGSEPLSLPATFESAAPSAPLSSAPSSLTPPPRTTTTLGLGQSAQPTQTPIPANLGPTRGATFTTSGKPPTLSYQDELILEIRIKGVDASDTILAYGTRGGVYLPLGTLARILDLAITVSDEGNYANGWVLDQSRTLTIDLRQGILTVGDKETNLPAGSAVAFEGELYLLSDRMADFMPLTVSTDLRGQVVTLETLEPFPFEERMEREAERNRLASRKRSPQENRWPRQETPWRLASAPMADVELRALSDNGAGPRGEIDLQLAGDLGYLTAEAFISADTINGLTSSLIEVGRQDPDAQLLGPLSATEFAIGDVSTVSMPVGLRSVTGRGFAFTNTPPEAVSVFEKIDLRGFLPDGYEVELYRNDILVGSTREAVNGQYEFIQVPVDFGLNIFRLVFFGPQGQRSEQVRRISVGDGRLAPGKLVYRVGAVQREENVLGVRRPNFVPPQDFGALRATAEVSYGLSSDITTVFSGAFFETALQDRWITSAGIRSGIGGFAVKADLATSNDSAFAISAGVAGKIGGSAINLSHVEYSGNFIDETRSVSGEFLKRSTELDFNTSISLGNPVSGLLVPLTARLRHLEGANGRKQTDAAVRASTRLPGFLASNTLEFSRTSLPQLASRSRLFGNFDLATLGRSKTRGRISLGYQVLPEPDLISASIEVDQAIDENTAIRGSLGYAFQSKSAQIGLSAVRDFDRFTLALDGNYGFRDNAYSVGLRLGFSLGRDPLRKNFFVARPGLANSGGASVRAFRDMDGDGVFGPTDSALPEVNFIAFNQTAATDGDGIARLSGLGSGRGVSVQVDSSTLPDIDLAPALEGIEIVPRPGRIHAAEFPIVAVSEVEGTVSFAQSGASKGVSGVRLVLRDDKGKNTNFTKTEIDGYYFFERVKPGTYTVALEPEQASRLNLCSAQEYTVTVGYEADIFKTDIAISLCDNELESAP